MLNYIQCEDIHIKLTNDVYNTFERLFLSYLQLLRHHLDCNWKHMRTKLPKEDAYIASKRP